MAIAIEGCRVCGNALPPYFGRGAHRLYCSRACNKHAYYVRHYMRHRARILAAGRRRYRSSEAFRARVRAYYEANRERIAEYKRAYYQSHRDETIAKERARYEGNRAEINRRVREYRLAHLDEIHIAARNRGRERRRAQLRPLFGGVNVQSQVHV